MSDRIPALKRKIDVRGDLLLVSPEDCLKAFIDMGLPSPPSDYIAIMTEFGVGSFSSDDLYFYPPPVNDHIYNILTRWEQWVKEDIDDFSSMPSDLTRNDLVGLLPIAGTAQNLNFFLDVSGGDEGVFLLDPFHRLEIFHFGDSLEEFLCDYWIGGKVNEQAVFEGDGRWQNEPWFKGPG